MSAGKAVCGLGFFEGGVHELPRRYIAVWRKNRTEFWLIWKNCGKAQNEGVMPLLTTFAPDVAKYAGEIVGESISVAEGGGGHL
jgi:hypothetical protein